MSVFVKAFHLMKLKGAPSSTQCTPSKWRTPKGYREEIMTYNPIPSSTEIGFVASGSIRLYPTVLSSISITVQSIFLTRNVLYTLTFHKQNRIKFRVEYTDGSEWRNPTASI